MKKHATFIICIFLLTCQPGCRQHDTLVENWYMTGKHWHDANQIDSAIHYYYRAESAITSATNPELKTKVYLNIADLLQRNDHYDLALGYYQKALDVFEREGDQRMSAYTLTDMGACRQRRKDSIPAIRACYDRALAIAPDDTVTGDIIQQIGLLYYFQDKHDSARHYLHRSLDYPYWKKYKQSVSLLFLGTSFYETGQLDTAEHYLLQALDCDPELRQQDGCYKILYKIATKRGDVANIAHYASLHAQCTDSIASLDNKLANELHDIKQEQTETLHEQKAKRNGWLVAAIGTLCIASGMFLLAYRKRKIQIAQAQQEQARLQQQKDQAIAQTEKLQQQLQQEQQQRENLQQLEAELKQKYEQEKVRALERHRQDCINRLREACAGAIHHPTLGPRYKTALLTAYDEVLHWNDTEQFIACIDKDFNRFARRIETCYLKRRSPNHAAIRLCTLLLLNAPKEHIQALMGYTTETYRKAIARLCKRFGVADREGLLIHLLHIMIEGM